MKKKAVIKPDIDGAPFAFIAKAKAFEEIVDVVYYSGRDVQEQLNQITAIILKLRHET